MNELTTTEQNRLLVLENIITTGEQTFIRVGQALLEIREKRLYRKDHSNFDDYVQSKWFKGKSWATRMISAAVVAESLPEKMVPMVTTERVARALVNVPSEKRAKVLEVAAKNGPVTSKSVAEAAKAIKPIKVVEEDDMGTVIPESALPVWNRRSEIRALMTQASALKCAIEKARNSGEMPMSRISVDCLRRVEDVHQELASCYPQVVCGSCEGRVPKAGCGTCEDTGFQSKQSYQRLTPEEDIRIRKAAIELRKNKDAATRLPAGVPRLNP